MSALARASSALAGRVHAMRLAAAAAQLQVLVEYSEREPDLTDDFIALADAVEEALPEVAVEGNVPPLGEARQGAFEVTAAGQLLHSRLAAGGEMPRAEDVVRKLRGIIDER